MVCTCLFCLLKKTFSPLNTSNKSKTMKQSVNIYSYIKVFTLAQYDGKSNQWLSHITTHWSSKSTRRWRNERNFEPWLVPVVREFELPLRIIVGVPHAHVARPVHDQLHVLEVALPHALHHVAAGNTKDWIIMNMHESQNV